MDSFHTTLEGFSPELYIATLSKVAHSDGLHPDEQEMLEQHAARLGVDLSELPHVPDDLSDLPWATRILVYRDAYMLALADGAFSEAEEEHLSELARRMKLSPGKADSIRVWVHHYEELLKGLEKILEASE